MDEICQVCLDFPSGMKVSMMQLLIMVSCGDDNLLVSEEELTFQVSVFTIIEIFGCDEPISAKFLRVVSMKV